MKILGWFGIIDKDEPIKYRKVDKCDDCGVITSELYGFNNCKFCKECYDRARSRFPSVKV